MEKFNLLLNFIINHSIFFSLTSILIILYYYYTSTFDYFEKRRVKYLKPTILLGNLGPRLTLKVSMHEHQRLIYQHFKGELIGGVFEGRRPTVYIIDSDLIKAVTIRDFDHFCDRNTLKSKEPKYLSRSLLNLKGLDWKGVRSTITPTFSSARLRNMLPLIENCSTQLIKYFKQYDQKEVEMKDAIGHFTLEVIGACAFGIECEALANEDSHFVKVAERFNDMSTAKRMLIFFVLIFMPKMFRFLNISFMNPATLKELCAILQEAKKERRSAKVKGNDFLQLLIDASEQEKLESGTGIHKTYLDEDTIDAQSLLFLIAGYETSSTLLSFAIHVMATKPELQEKLRNHINDITEGKELTYEVLSEMTYLEGFLLETLRLYPPLARIDRTVTKTYTIPGTSVTLEPGAVVVIPAYGVHMDPEIYPEPQEFRPERFMDEEKRNRPTHLFLAFGTGPRNCIGLRFAIISAKMAMVSLLKNFKFKTCSKTRDPVDFEKRGILLKTSHGLWVTIESLQAA